MTDQSPIDRDECRWRLHRIAAEWGIEPSPEPSPLTRPPSAPRSPVFQSNDDFLAEGILKRRRQLASQSQDGGNGGMRRAFTLRRKDSFNTKEIFDALDAHVADAGSPGVAEALINRLRLAGGDINVANTKGRGAFHMRRKSLDSFERSRILQKAVDNNQEDMVTVLLPHADPLALDTALPKALRGGSVRIAELLLSYGANVSQTRDGLDAFRELCATGAHPELASRILQSDGRPPPEVVSQAALDAAARGNVDTVLRLSRATADGSHKGAAALKEAVAQCRVDVALAILTGAKPPSVQCLNEALSQVFIHPTIMPNEKMSFTEILLCAGACGDVVDAGLVQACLTEFGEMIELLISYGASIDFHNALVVREVIGRENTSMALLLLNSRAPLRPSTASDLVACIPKRINPEDRRTLLSQLLKKGATGQALDDALIDAVEMQDVECAKLLLTPHFSGTGRLQPKASHDLRRGPRSMVFERHAVADPNHKAGLALSIAVMVGSLPLVSLLLAARPSAETLAHVFPGVNNLQYVNRYVITEAFLAAGVAGPCVHAALQEAVDEEPPKRDEKLIRLLLAHDSDVHAGDAGPVLSAIERQKVDLLAALLQTRPTTKSAAGALVKAMGAQDPDKRVHMVRLVLQAGADAATKTVGEALSSVLQAQPPDIRLLDVLLRQGKADVNFSGGDPMVLAVRNEDPQVLELVLQLSKPTPETLDLAVQAMSNLASTPEKVAKLDSLLKRTKHKETLNSLLVTEVQAILQTPPEKRLLTILKTLLESGVDVNAHKAAALCHAVRAANSQITDILLGAKPSPSSLAAAMPHALKIEDAMDRLWLTKKLLHAGAPPVEANRALLYAISTFPDDLPLLNILVGGAKTSDGEALTAAIKKGRSDLVELILTRSNEKYPAPALNQAFDAATRIQDKDQRKIACELLLKAGVSGPVVSEALLAVIDSGDLTLGAVLLDHGASVDHAEGQAIVAACKAGSAGVLQMLLSGNKLSPHYKGGVQKVTLERGFQAATHVRDLKERAAVFKLLMDKGISRQVVDEQLVSAARFGDDALDLVKLLLSHGASTDYSNGEAVFNATRCAFMRILEVMLGVAEVGGKPQKPSKATMTRALKASWRLSADTRHQVMEWLFAAGLPATEEVHVALTKAVNEEVPNVALVRMLLDHGASPLTNGCQALVDATTRFLVEVLDVFFEVREIPVGDVAWAFKQSFTPEQAERWLSEEGLQTAQRLLEKGAQGDGPSSALCVAIDHCSSDKSAIASRFIELLIQHDADVNYGGGEAITKAAKSANLTLIKQVLQRKPNAASVSMAFPYIFDHELSEDQALEMITLFMDYHDGEQRLDAMFSHPESEPVVFRAISKYPRSTKILETLLDAGYYHDQMATARVLDEVKEEEPVNLLTWCLLQPQKRVSSGLITVLIGKGAKVNFETRVSKTTPLMVAIRERRQDLVRHLIVAGAEVDVVDITGNTPLTLSTRIGGDLGTGMMTSILAAEPSRNDGSLHNTARELNLQAMQVLVDFGHDVDFPSPLHGGRSALGELCLQASDGGPLGAAQEKKMEKAMSYLMSKETDLSLLNEGKSALFLALHSLDPLPTTRALLKVGMWKHINQPFNQFTDGKFTYSPTTYVKLVLPQSSTTDQLHALLKANRAQDVYFANEGPQPEGAVGLPDDMVRQERERKARLERIALEAEDHKRRLSWNKEVADMQNKIQQDRAALEDARKKRQRDMEVDGIRERARVEDEVFAEQVRRRRAERNEAMSHATAMVDAEVQGRRAIADADAEAEGRRQLQLLEHEKAMNGERTDGARALSAVRVSERQELEKLDRAQDGRIQARLVEQKKLVQQQQQILIGQVPGPVGRRPPMGFIAGELN